MAKLLKFLILNDCYWWSHHTHVKKDSICLFSGLSRWSAHLCHVTNKMTVNCSTSKLKPAKQCNVQRIWNTAILCRRMATVHYPKWKHRPNVPKIVFSAIGRSAVLTQTGIQNTKPYHIWSAAAVYGCLRCKEQDMCITVKLCQINGGWGNRTHIFFNNEWCIRQQLLILWI